jgi:polyisoprenoid-binding protein YceI
MKRTILSAVLAFASIAVFAQKKTTTSATIAFDATTPIDALPKAENKTVVAALDTKAGTIQFEAAIKSFAFSNPRIQQHFNAAGWMDSDNFPKSTFNGTITNLSKVNFAKAGTYTADVEGALTIHGVEQKIKTTASVVVKDGVITTTSEFSIKLADYKVDGPSVGQGKVSKEPKITVTADFN